MSVNGNRCLSGSSALLNDKISTLPLKRVREYTLFLFFVGGYEQSYLSSGLSRAATFQVRTLINEQRLGDVLAKRYPGTHDYATDKALWQYTQDLKNQFLRNAPPINKVMYDNKIHVLKTRSGYIALFLVCRAAS